MNGLMIPYYFLSHDVLTNGEGQVVVEEGKYYPCFLLPQGTVCFENAEIGSKLRSPVTIKWIDSVNEMCGSELMFELIER